MTNGPFQAKSATCSVEGCSRTARTRGWCGFHYQRWRLEGDVGADRPCRTKSVPVRKCKVNGCENDQHAHDLCYRHYERWKAYGDPEAPLRRNRDGEGYRGLNHDGYVVIKRHGQKQILEHRQVMEEMRGRPLLPGETVHHKNGKRDDNRPENLELWVSTRSGQRAADLVAFVVERYRAEVLAALGG